MAPASPSHPLRVALLCIDAREAFREYHKPQPYFGTAPEALLEGFSLLPEVEVHVVSCIQKPMAAPENLAPNIYYHSLLVPKLGWLRTGYQGCIRATRRFLQHLKPDIVHGQGTERDCALAAVFSGFPNVLTIHGNMRAVARVYKARPFTFRWLAARLEALALPRTAGVFCNSAYTQQCVQPPARKTWRVPNPLQLPFFEVSPTPSPGPPILLNVGNIEPRKRQLELLEVVGRLHQAGCRFKLHFVGHLDRTTPYAARFLNALRQAEVQGYARYLGVRSVSELLATYDTASALVHVPLEEAFGLVVAEALARNRMVFAFETGGVAEILEGVPDVARLPAGDWSALTQAMQRWLEEGGTLPANSASLMRARYHPEVIARRHLEIYREVLDQLPMVRGHRFRAHQPPDRKRA